MLNMKKLAIILFFSLFLSGCSIKNLFVKNPAGLEVTTSLPSEVFIDGESVGETPYKNQNVKPGSYTVKLVPKDGNNSLQIWEINLQLSSKVSTIINHTFAATDAESQNYTLQFQPVADKSKAYLSVISDPGTANITQNGQPRGFTPVTKQETDPGSHTIEISSPGFKTITLSVNTVQGYNLVINAKLAQELIILKELDNTATDSAKLESDEEASNPDNSDTINENLDDSDSATNETPEIERPYVTIEETETGWLRVRDEPNTTTSTELGKVNVGEKLIYIKSNETGWHKIIFENEEGWISGKYATLYN